MTDIIYLFTDGSVNPQLKVGYGAVLLTKDINQPKEVLKQQVKLKRFIDTSSTKLELENLLWALSLVKKEGNSTIVVYTDSQNILGLQERRLRLENNNYLTRGNKEVKNQDLYKEFYRKFDAYNIQIIKVRGHQPGRQKTQEESVFTLVDRASRKAIREEYKK